MTSPWFFSSRLITRQMMGGDLARLLYSLYCHFRNCQTSSIKSKFLYFVLKNWVQLDTNHIAHLWTNFVHLGGFWNMFWLKVHQNSAISLMRRPRKGLLYTNIEGKIGKPKSEGWGLEIAVRKRRRGSSAATLALLAFLHGRLSRKLSRAEERRLVGRERRDG